MQPEPAHPAVTPLFRVLTPRPAEGEGVDRLSASVSGQSRREIRVLCTGAFALFAVAAWDLTAWMGMVSLWVRLPTAALLAFALPHFLFTVIAGVVPVRGDAPSVRQAWAFLLTLTFYAAARFPGGGWGQAVCGAWLALAALNLLAWPFSRRR